MLDRLAIAAPLVLDRESWVRGFVIGAAVATHSNAHRDGRSRCVLRCVTRALLEANLPPDSDHERDWAGVALPKVARVLYVLMVARE